jgi:hypothetical protein
MRTSAQKKKKYFQRYSEEEEQEKRDHQKEKGITAKAYSRLLKRVRWQDYGSCCVDTRFIPAS